MADLNGNDQPEGTRGCVYAARLAARSTQRAAGNFGRSLNTYGDYPRTWNLEHGLELQHELLPRLSTTGSWFHGSFHDLALSSVDQNLTGADYTPITVYSPITGQPFVAYQRTVGSIGQLNVDRHEPNREQMYDAFGLQLFWRPASGAQVFGGVSVERELQVNCTAPDDPNELLFCDDRENEIPWKTQLKLSAFHPLPWGLTASAVLLSTPGPNATTLAGVGTATRNMVISSTSRYP